MKRCILVTGGAGFIGGNFVLEWFKSNKDIALVNLDKLTYAGNLKTLHSIADNPLYTFIQGDIGNKELVPRLLQQYQPEGVINFAAESHVDRSIDGPAAFIETNIVGTFSLLESVRSYWEKLLPTQQEKFRFLHVSTDEVFGTLQKEAVPFTETHLYQPNSPYSASKAASDHLVRAWYHTYGLPVLTTNCSNNYGPYHFPEKLIPLIIVHALEGKNLPIYGDGQQIRDWLYVKDHCAAICCVLNKGRVGETYNIGGWNEKTNIEVVTLICERLDQLKPKSDGSSYKEQIVFVKDRPGHDKRYAIDASKIERELGWRPQETFESGIHKTIEWYLANTEWVSDVVNGTYREWIETQYAAG